MKQRLAQRLTSRLGDRRTSLLEPVDVDTAFEKRDAEVLAKSSLNFVPLATLGVVVSEILPFVHDGFPSTPLVSGFVVVMLAALYFLARSGPSRGVMVVGTAAAAILASAYVGFACSESGGFNSPHLIALMVIFAFVSGLLTLTVLESSLTIGLAMLACGGTIVGLTPGSLNVPPDATVALMYVMLLAMVAVVTNRAGRFVRRRAFERSLQVEALHRYAVEEVLCRHLSPQYVEYALSEENVLDAPAERRVVTMLFADVVGFSKMAEALTLEELETLMTKFYDSIATITFRYGATLDKFIGDAVMVIVGAPLAQQPEHQAAIAVSMSQDWHVAIDALGREYLGRPLRVRVGVHQGEVAVGAFGGEHRLDYTVLGSAVNIAARLEPLAPAGGTAMSDVVRGLCGLEDDQLEFIGDQVLKGVVNPVPVWLYRSDACSTEASKTP